VRKRHGERAASVVRPETFAMTHDREWRVHQHDARREASAEVIVDLRYGDGRKEGVEQFCAHLGQFVQVKRRAIYLGKNGEQACAS